MADLLQGLNLYLVGMMGTGKSTVGRLLARALEYRFFDCDELAEQISGKTVSELFAERGENGFRTLETKILRELGAQTRSVISTGGGVVTRAQNWSYLQYGLSVWLDAPVELLVKRLADDTSRPLLQETDPEEKLAELLAARRDLYAQSDLRVEIGPDELPNQLVNKIIAAIPQKIKPKSDASINE
ncbi:MAG: shikimate kinase [Cyanobacteria bacterium P01_H01_bin.15]